jgi:hypothetical protein
MESSSFSPLEDSAAGLKGVTAEKEDPDKDFGSLEVLTFHKSLLLFATRTGEVLTLENILTV